MRNTTRPNILIFMTDHQRGDMTPPHSKALTPNLDQFFTQSVTFTQTYCPAPHCCPARATFFSGLYPSQHGVWNNVNVGNTLSRGLHDGVRLWSEDLREAGYDLTFTGKWHVSDEEGPQDRGFTVTDIQPKYTMLPGRRPAPHTDEWRVYRQKGLCTQGMPRGEGEIIRPGYPLYVQYGENENPFRDSDKIESAIPALLAKKDSVKPWCHFIGTLGPHDPYMVPKRFSEMYDIDDIQLPESFSDPMTDKPALYRRTRDRYNQLTHMEQRQSILHYLAFCTYEDDLFGQVLNALDEMGEKENTLVIYVSDHGDYVGEHGLWAKGLPCFRQAYHVPLLMRWPQGIKNPGRVVKEFISLADIAPTLLEAAHCPARAFTGESLMPFLRDETPVQWRDAVFTQTNGNELYGIQRSVMTQDWKYVYNGFDYDELYDLKNDPQELHNLINDPEYQPVLRELCKKLWSFAYQTKDVCINPYIMVAHVPYGPGIIFEEADQK